MLLTVLAAAGTAVLTGCLFSPSLRYFLWTQFPGVFDCTVLRGLCQARDLDRVSGYLDTIGANKKIPEGTERWLRVAIHIRGQYLPSDSNGMVFTLSRRFRVGTHKHIKSRSGKWFASIPTQTIFRRLSKNLASGEVFWYNERGGSSVEGWKKDNRKEVVITDVESIVPKDHLLRKIERVMDYEWIYERMRPYCCADNGRPGTDPVVLIKMVLLQHLFDLPSLRQTYREIQVNAAYRWSLGYNLLEEIPHFATVSYAFCNRFPPELSEEIFAHILNKALNNRMVEPKMVFIDGTHIKASAERVFADAKEKHGMRYTHHRGLARVSAWVRLKFAAMNLKKLALWCSRGPAFFSVSFPTPYCISACLPSVS